MTMTQSLRNWIAAQPEPPLMSEACAGAGFAGSLKAMRAVSEMARKGLLVRSGTPGHYRYAIGRDLKKCGGSKPRGGPQPRKPRKDKLSPEEKRERQRLYDQKRNAKRAAERRARGLKTRPPRKPLNATRKLHVVPSSPGMTSDDFVAAGGVIEVLPGFQRDNVHARRRPVWSANNRAVAI